MKTKKNVVMVAVMLLSIGFTSCKKGDTGEPGKDGNANVTSMTLSSPSWAWDASNYWRKSIWTGASILTSDVASSGSVMLYQNTSGVYVALPLAVNYTGTVQEHDWFTYSTGIVNVYVENSDLSDPIAQIPSSVTYKLVCIPKSGMITHPGVDLRNYEQVKKAFDIKD